VTFDVDAGAYARFMGRYSEPLASEFVELIGIRQGQQALDVGCGPGALTAELVQLLGAPAVCAVDPSESFVAAVRARFGDLDVRLAGAEQLPFANSRFDLALAQLVVHFMADPVLGLSEMARVTRPGGLVAASVWDHAGGRGPLSLFWQAVAELDPEARDESGLAGARDGHLAELFVRAGLREVEPCVLTVRVGYPSFSDWWEPYTLGVGPAGSYVGKLDPQQCERLRARCERMLPSAPFDITASAWTTVGRV
jgi:ubiquinone/menaquinone biosynthesis C-methylase UbiE